MNPKSQSVVVDVLQSYLVEPECMLNLLRAAHDGDTDSGEAGNPGPNEMSVQEADKRLDGGAGLGGAADGSLVRMFEDGPELRLDFS
ncbi:MAG: hypothetical protein O7E57_06605 [Gammaproteobacteria bacterium]|nr:hypothetical protein [Gammaproteobacteria bacterium]